MEKASAEKAFPFGNFVKTDVCVGCALWHAALRADRSIAGLASSAHRVSEIRQGGPKREANGAASGFNLSGICFLCSIASGHRFDMHEDPLPQDVVAAVMPEVFATFDQLRAPLGRGG
ncbi:MAG: hypothetical protein J7L98_06560 [Candidatus Verstraetearchaeota archaeon]|nr:hypothetical protein [Candidatus Verstraetearchaeota archaeon]